MRSSLFVVLCGAVLALSVDCTDSASFSCRHNSDCTAGRVCQNGTCVGGSNDGGNTGQDGGNGGGWEGGGNFPAGSFGATCNAPTSLSGVALAPNGTDPISQAEIAVFDHQPVPLPTGVYCTTCNSTVTDTPLAVITSGTNGAFSLSLDDVPRSATLYVTFRKAMFRRILVNQAITACADNPLTAAQSSLPGTSAQGDLPRIAVSSGASDHLEKVLNAMGVTQFDCVKGSTSSHDTCTSPTTLGQLLTDPTTMNEYAMIFIACQPADAFEPHTPGATTQNLASWAGDGGKLVVTDDSYDFVEQTWPDAIRFEGSVPAMGVPQVWNVGEVGIPTSSLTGTVTDGNLASWLGLFPGAINANNQVDLVGFLSDWGVQATVAASTTSIVHGVAAWDGGSGDVPLTSEFQVNNCGRVIYSSYHTSNSGTAGTLLPQERILEYLMFEVGSCVTIE